MSKKDKDYYDDGHSIADMSGVTRSTPSFFGRPKPTNNENFNHKAFNNNQNDIKNSRPWEDNSLNKKEKFMVILGAIKATLLVVSVYIAVLAIIILIMQKFWA